MIATIHSQYTILLRFNLLNLEYAYLKVIISAKHLIIGDFITKKTENNVSDEKQQILPFSIKKEKKIRSSNFKLPPINFLEKRDNTNNKININEVELNKKSEFLEKILLDFDVQGKIKRISYGPVVTLNEFEPAAGIKVSKIINLSEDIARNTSSQSARISTIPGRNTIGIELPNASRENVYLSEILSHGDFSKKILSYQLR